MHKTIQSKSPPIIDYFEGTDNVTHTFSQIVSGFGITNDGSSDLTVTINGLTITVKAGEVFEDSFVSFTTATITTTVPYRAWGR